MYFRIFDLPLLPQKLKNAKGMYQLPDSYLSTLARNNSRLEKFTAKGSKELFGSKILELKTMMLVR